MQKKFIIVIPVYNEQEIIEKIIKEIQIKFKKLNYEILILNDGSTDNTLEKLNNFKKQKKITVINKKNEGHGKTLIKGYKLALRKKIEYILQIDGDNQIPLREYFQVVKNIDKGDIVCGLRFQRKDPLIRIITTKILKFLILLRHQVLIEDSNIPFRIIKKKFLKENINYINQSNVPNIFLSIIAAKNKSFFQIKTKHKVRSTGVVSIRKFKLFIFCFKTFWEVMTFKSK